MSTTKTLGLLVGDELDWPDALEALCARLGKTIKWRGKTYEIDVRRCRIDPFSLRDASKYSVVIDRLAYWHFTPREWLKKAAMIDGTYLLNNPFTFQSMEKHTAYCAMIRLGLHIPETWLIPPKRGPDTEKYRKTAARYHDWFDLSKIADHIGYPLFMKPFDGGGWRDVTRIRNREELLRAYDNSGQTVMHLQKGLEDYEVFCRSLAIGPQVINLRFQPEKPQHARYAVDHNFLGEEHGREVRIITKLINAFFRWDFNSCETIHKDGTVWPIDFANACPDVAINSLHYYFPWAIRSLVAWSLYCAVSERRFKIALDTDPYFAVADSDRSYQEKLTEYEKLADEHFCRDEFEAFVEEALPDLDEALYDFVTSEDLDRILIQTIKEIFPPHEHVAFYNHFRGLINHWAQGNDPNPEPEPEPAAAEAKTDAKPDTKTGAKPDAKPRPKADAKPQPKADPKA